MRVLARRLLERLVLLALAGVLGATLVRFAPGFSADEREADPRLSAESIQSIRDERAREGDLPRFYWRYFSGLARGDFGVSQALNRPVRSLVAERVPVTLRAAGFGLLAGWLAGLAAALAFSLPRLRGLAPAGTVASGMLLSLPEAVLALAFVFFGGTVKWAIALVVFPRVYRYAKNLLARIGEAPHVLAAHARGLGPVAVLSRHILPVAAPELLALAGISVSVAVGASIPIEVMCDSPGIGQLAWHAALGRDLPVLVTLTLLVTAITLMANTASDVAAGLSGAGRT